ncbi:MTTase N-terminal domain-containing protein [Caenorhabditis elegans]|uniref:MTTase N-terminal domain-containing protein n=1 Tax=Caenorhabditis elegans TaxID=6239 RepID=Q9BKW0_CAEEL|nr:MTTase N-terminal domain-containing protein [Caenorhabditis elegans]CCD72952.2 MTTase N-terminal domain-containing protein [Caenorhabditis elegans]
MDIEDIVGRGPVGSRDANEIKIRTRKQVPKEQQPDDANVDSMVPGVGQKVWVRTWGCSHNTSDSEYMSGLLQQAGYDVVKGFSIIFGIYLNVTFKKLFLKNRKKIFN